jgi:hypothetical protein
MDFGVGILGDLDETRFCFLRVRLLKELIKDYRILDALLQTLQVPGKSLAALKKLDEREKINLIEAQIEHFRGSKTSLWYGIDAPEVLAASIWRSAPLSNTIVLKEIFRDVIRENELAAPVAKWLAARNYDPYGEIPMGTKRIDVLGHKKVLFGLREQLIGIELKNEVSQLQRGLDQMTTFGEYAHGIYLACTPALAAEYLDRHSSGRNVHHWDPKVFHRKLKSFGFGLLLVEGEKVYEILKPSEREPDGCRIKETIAALSQKLKISLDS